MDANKGVLICGELADGKLAPVTIELLGAGRKLANELGEELAVLLLGSNTGAMGKEAIAYGADKVYAAEDSLFDNYNSDAYTQAAANLCRKIMPAVMLLGHTDIGMDLAPRLNGRLGGGLAMDCLALAIDPATKMPGDDTAGLRRECACYRRLKIRPAANGDNPAEDSTGGGTQRFATGSGDCNRRKSRPGGTENQSGGTYQRAG